MKSHVKSIIYAKICRFRSCRNSLRQYELWEEEEEERSLKHLALRAEVYCTIPWEGDTFWNTTLKESNRFALLSVAGKPGKSPHYSFGTQSQVNTNRSFFYFY